mgnify:CR=1 FL=1
MGISHVNAACFSVNFFSRQALWISLKFSGSGLGGRNQELALSAAPGLEGLSDAAVFSFGSDGTDGPTDAAGGYADGRTAAILRALGRTAEAWLDDNDAWHALAQTGGLLRTGPTGTNVNDLSVLLIGKPRLTF